MTEVRKWATRTLSVLAVLLILLSFLPLWQTDHWWVRQWDYPRIQVAGRVPLPVPPETSARRW